MRKYHAMFICLLFAGPAQAGSCEHFLKMVGRLSLPQTKLNQTYASGFRFDNAQTGREIFFKTLRSVRAENVARTRYDKAPFKEQVRQLHQMSWTMALASSNSQAFARFEKFELEGPGDIPISLLLELRAQFVLDYMLHAVVNASPADLKPYFEELTTIASDFSRIRWAHGVSLVLMDTLDSAFDVYSSGAQPTLTQTDLWQVRFHAHANLTLHKRSTPRLTLKETLSNISSSLRSKSPIQQVLWIGSELAWRTGQGIAKRRTPEELPARLLIQDLIDELPGDLSILKTTYAADVPDVVEDLDELIRQLDKNPTLCDDNRLNKLKILRSSLG